MFIVNDRDTENPTIPSFLETGCTANIYSGNWGPSEKLLKIPVKSVNFLIIKVKIIIERL